jgi:hypothetical protein
MDALTLIYLPEQPARDKLFMRDFFKNYPQLPYKSLLLHDAGVSNPEVARYASKRLSANLSEYMVPNHMRSGDERNLITSNGSGFAVKEALFRKMYRMVHAIVMNPIIGSNGQAQMAQPAEMLQALRQQLPVEQVLLFPENPKSLLGNEPHYLADAAEYERLMGIYPEEANTLKLAHALAPSYIVAASNFHDVTGK